MLSWVSFLPMCPFPSPLISQHEIAGRVHEVPKYDALNITSLKTYMRYLEKAKKKRHTATNILPAVSPKTVPKALWARFVLLKTVLAAAAPLFMDFVPLTLEEIFIYELGGAEHEAKDIVL